MAIILIIDDEEDIQLLYRKELEAKGYQAVTAGTIKEGKELFLRGGINLVILDIKLTTEESGLDFLRWIRKTERTIPVIINSAYPSYKIDLSTWLANEYLVKSGDLNELLNTVAKLLQQLASQNKTGGD